MQKVSSSLIQSISASQILKGSATDGQVLSYNSAVEAWVPVDGGSSGGSGNDAFKLPLAGGTLTGNLYLNSAALSSTARISIANDLSSSGVFSAGNLLLGSNPESLYFGRTSLAENQLTVSESSVGQTWSAVLSSTNNNGWTSIATSSDGKHQTAVGLLSGIYVSNNYGNDWVWQMSTVPLNWKAVAMSIDGTFQVAATDQYIYVSSNSGKDWSLNTLNIGARNWSGVATSADGRIQVACASSIAGNGFIYKSSDYGKTWLPATDGMGTLRWSSVAISSDGKYQTAVVQHLLNGYIYRSTDYGVNWTAITTQGKLWDHVNMSADGKYQIAIIDGDYIYRSINYGLTWNPVATPNNWKSVSISANGKIQIAHLISTTDMFLSTDWGASWNLISPLVPATGASTWIDTAMTSDAKLVLALEATTGIYKAYSVSNLIGSLAVTDSITTSAVYAQVYYGDGSKLTNVNAGLASTISTRLSGDGVTETFFLSGYNTSDKGKYFVSVGGLDQPPDFWTIGFTAGKGFITFVQPPKYGEFISIRTFMGTASAGSGTGGIGDTGPGNAIQIQSRNIADVQPLDGQALVWSSTNSQWEPRSVQTGSGTTVITQLTGNGITASFQISGYSGTDPGKYLVSVGGLDQPPQFWTIDLISGTGTITFVEAPGAGKIISVRSLSGVSTDNSYQSSNTNAVQIQGRNVSSTAPTNTQVLAWNSSTSLWTPTNTLTAADAISLQGRTISNAAPTNTQVLAWNSSTSTWTPTNTLTAADALSIQGRNVSSAAPTNTQVLAWNSSTSTWTPTNTLTAADANSIRGVNVSTTAPINGQVLTYNSTSQRYEPSVVPVTFARTRYIGNGLQRSFFPIQGYIDDDETRYLVTVSSLLTDSDQTNGDFTITSERGGTITFGGSVPGNDAKIICRALGSTGNLEVAKKALTIITSQPQSITREPGQAASFSVTATGATAVTYQWYANGQLLVGQTSNIISGTSDQGLFVTGATFYVVVRADGGTVTSNTVNFTVLVGPNIVTHPSDKVVASDNSFSLSVVATGATSYQWYKGDSNGNNFALINGATNTTYVSTAPLIETTTSVTPYPNVDTYRCSVGNAAGSRFSNNCTVTTYFQGITNFGISPSTPVCDDGGTSVTLTIDVVGTFPIQYLWKISTDAGNNWSDAGSTTQTIALPNTIANNGNAYKCVVTNNFDQLSSESVTLTVNPVPPTVSSISNIIMLSGSNISVSPIYSGTAPVTYSWEFFNSSQEWQQFEVLSNLNGNAAYYGIPDTCHLRAIATNSVGFATANFDLSSVNSLSHGEFNYTLNSSAPQALNLGSSHTRGDILQIVNSTILGGGYTDENMRSVSYRIFGNSESSYSAYQNGVDTLLISGNVDAPSNNVSFSSFVCPGVTSDLKCWLEIFNEFETIPYYESTVGGRLFTIVPYVSPSIAPISNIEYLLGGNFTVSPSYGGSGNRVLEWSYYDNGNWLVFTSAAQSLNGTAAAYNIPTTALLRFSVTNEDGTATADFNLSAVNPLSDISATELYDSYTDTNLLGSTVNYYTQNLHVGGITVNGGDFNDGSGAKLSTLRVFASTNSASTSYLSANGDVSLHSQVISAPFSNIFTPSFACPNPGPTSSLYIYIQVKNNLQTLVSQFIGTIVAGPIPPTIEALSDVTILQGASITVTPVYGSTAAEPVTYSWKYYDGVDWIEFPFNANNSTLAGTADAYGIPHTCSIRIYAANIGGTVYREFNLSSIVPFSNLFVLGTTIDSTPTAVGQFISLQNPAQSLTVTGISADGGSFSDGTARSYSHLIFATTQSTPRLYQTGDVFLLSGTSTTPITNLDTAAFNCPDPGAGALYIWLALFNTVTSLTYGTSLFTVGTIPAPTIGPISNVKIFAGEVITVTPVYGGSPTSYSWKYLNPDPLIGWSQFADVSTLSNTAAAYGIPGTTNIEIAAANSGGTATRMFALSSINHMGVSVASFDVDTVPLPNLGDSITAGGQMLQVHNFDITGGDDTNGLLQSATYRVFATTSSVYHNFISEDILLDTGLINVPGSANSSNTFTCPTASTTLYIWLSIATSHETIHAELLCIVYAVTKVAPISDVIIAQGSTISVTPSVSGSTPITYEWSINLNGSPYTLTTSDTLNGNANSYGLTSPNDTCRVTLAVSGPGGDASTSFALSSIVPITNFFVATIGGLVVNDTEWNLGDVVQYNVNTPQTIRAGKISFAGGNASNGALYLTNYRLFGTFTTSVPTEYNPQEGHLEFVSGSSYAPYNDVLTDSFELKDPTVDGAPYIWLEISNGVESLVYPSYICTSVII